MNPPVASLVATRIDSPASFIPASWAEGFPNIPLEAWARGLRSVGVVDPDQAASAHRAGVRVDDEHDFIEAIRGLMYDPWQRRVLRAAAGA